jgi:Ca-activated chloride channel family protein
VTFARPALLALAFVAFAALVALVRYAERRRTIQALTYSNVAFALDALRPPRWPGVLLAGAFFTGAFALLVPPTDDLDAVRDALDRIPPPDGGTAIGEALALAAEQLPARGRRIVVLMTDGVYNVGRDPLEASHELGARGITIETVGIGTSGSGQFVPGTADLADLDAGALRAIAANGNGRYAEAADARGLAEAFRTIALGTVWETKRVDGSLPFAFSGGLLVIVAFVAGLASGRVP